MPLPAGYRLEEPQNAAQPNLPPGFKLEDKSQPQAKPAFRPNMWTEKPFGSGIADAAYNLGGKATDLATKWGATPERAGLEGYLANVATQVLPSLLTNARVSDAPIKSVLDWPARKWMQSALKPNANVDKATFNRGSTTMLQGEPNATGYTPLYSPTHSGVRAMRDQIGTLKPQVTEITNASKKVIDVAPAAQNASRIIDKVQEGTMAVDDTAAAQRVIDNLYRHPAVDEAGTMSVSAAQAMKDRNYARLGDIAYRTGAKSTDEADSLKAVTAGLRKGIERAEPSTGPLNARISDLINALKLSQRRAIVEGNKDLLPLGATVAGAAGNTGVAAASYISSNSPIKSLIAHLLHTSGRPNSLASGGIGYQQSLAEQLRQTEKK